MPDLVPGPGIEPSPLYWERGVLTTGPPGKSLEEILNEHQVTFLPSLNPPMRVKIFHSFPSPSRTMAAMPAKPGPCRPLLLPLLLGRTWILRRERQVGGLNLGREFKWAVLDSLPAGNER